MNAAQRELRIMCFLSHGPGRTRDVTDGIDAPAKGTVLVTLKKLAAAGLVRKRVIQRGHALWYLEDIST